MPTPLPTNLLEKHTFEVAESARILQIVGGHQSVQAVLHPPLLVDPPVGVPTPPPPSPPPLLSKLDFDTGPITFNNGVTVGGSANPSLFPNGAFSFSGHFHDSGAASYDGGFVWALRAGTSVFTFAKQGRMHGTFEAGSRDWDWGDSAVNAAIADYWETISRQGYNWNWNSAMNVDLGQLVDAVTKAVAAVNTSIGAVKTVISVVAG